MFMCPDYLRNITSMSTPGKLCFIVIQNLLFGPVLILNKYGDGVANCEIGL